MAKYDPLHNHLKQARTSRVEMSFADIERIVGDKLPESAWKHRPWWSNGGGPQGPMVQAVAWLTAGFAVEWVDQDVGKVAFERK